ncbi:MAG TPA: ABC transporter substrate-binding protein [Thermoanaerobaculia bacterium]
MIVVAALVVGLLLPPDEPEAASIRKGALAAVAEANAAGGPVVVLKIRGRKGPWGSDAAEAARLVEEDGASVLIAPPDGSATHLVLQVSGRTGVPVFTLCADSSVTKTAVPWVARVVPSTVEQARGVFAKTPGTRWLAVVPAARAGREAARDLTAAKGSGVSLVTVEAGSWSGPDGLRDLRRVMSNIRPDAVLVWLPPTGAKDAVAAFRATGYAGPVTVRSQAVPSPLEAYARDAASLAIRVLRGPHGAEPRRAFPLAGGFVGATGRMTFDSSGNRSS